MIDKHFWIVLVSVLLAIDTQSALADQPKKTDPASALGIRFVAALAKKDVAAAKKCWTQWPLYEKLYKALPKKVRDQIPPENLEKHRKYIAARDEVLTDFLPNLLKLLEREGVNVKSLKHEKTKLISIRGSGERKAANAVRVYAKDAKGIQIVLRIDDGAYYNGRWYFTDKPYRDVVLVKNGKERRVFVKDGRQKKK